MKHGTPRAYKDGCRCAACTESQRVAIDGYRARRREKRHTALLLAAETIDQRAQSATFLADGVLSKEMSRIAQQLRRSAFALARTNAQKDAA